MSRLGLKTSSQALIFAVVAEIGMFIALFNTPWENGPISPVPTSILGILLLCTQLPGVIVGSKIAPTGSNLLGAIIMFGVNTSIWWIVFYIIIFCYRQFTKKNELI
jgi:hypothetical protein